jgi:hypothetical protein
MTVPNTIVLLAQGNPVTRLWLPRSRDLSELTVTIRAGDNGSEPIRRKVVSLGLTPVVRVVGRARGVDLQIWVNWVQQGETPQGFDAVRVAEALTDATFGPAVRALQDAMNRS